jgi:hypothetical protein
MAMMGRAIIGAVAAAVAMFILGFIFFTSGLQKTVTGSLEDVPAAAVQQVLAANLPGTGTYVVPDPEVSSSQTVMYGQGPVATIHYNTSGFPAMDSGSLLAGFIHMLVVTLLMAAALYLVSRHVASFADRAKLLVLGVLAGTIFMRLGEPIWYNHGWSYAIYMFIADAIALTVAGVIILKLLPAAVYRGTHEGAPSDV